MVEGGKNVVLEATLATTKVKLSFSWGLAKVDQKLILLSKTDIS